MRFIASRLMILVMGLCLLLTGCVHRIHVNPASNSPATITIPAAVQFEVPFLAIEGADHMPGIAMLDWPAKDLRQAIVRYFSERQTFRAIGTDPADLKMVVKAWLTLRAPDRYLYRVHLEADLSHPGHGVFKTYAAEGEALGSSVRWITASDQEPIDEATSQALQILASQLEQDRDLIMSNLSR
ncbi:MAG: hypothetical protein KF854_06710 [Nitrospira sp.]|nr:hypothetical protein [Nitrospira sp.]